MTKTVDELMAIVESLPQTCVPILLAAIEQALAEATQIERERAAKVCGEMVRYDKHGYPDYPSSYAQVCADAIRKGEKT